MKRKTRLFMVCCAAALLPYSYGLNAQTLGNSAPADAATTTNSQLIPQPEGTPLPPREPSVAANWPPEMKALIDNMLGLFRDRASPPTVEEIESKLKIKLVDTLKLDPQVVAYYRLGPDNLRKHYTVTQALYLIPPVPSNQSVRRWNEAYYVYKDSSNTPPEKRRDTHVLSLALSRYPDICLDPYELAVYLGEPFCQRICPYCAQSSCQGMGMGVCLGHVLME